MRPLYTQLSEKGVDCSKFSRNGKSHPSKLYIKEENNVRSVYKYINYLITLAYLGT